MLATILSNIFYLPQVIDNLSLFYNNTQEVQSENSIYFYIFIFMIFLIFFEIFSKIDNRRKIPGFVKIQSLVLSIFCFSWLAIHNCQNLKNHQKFFKLQRDFTQKEFRENARELGLKLHPNKALPDSDKRKVNNKYFYYLELREVLMNTRNYRLIKLYNDYGVKVDLISVKLTDLNKTVEANVFLFEITKHIIQQIQVICLTILIFWDASDRSYFEHILAVLFFFQNVGIKVYIWNSDKLIGTKNFIEYKKMLGMEYAIKPDLYQFVDMMLVISHMSIYIYGKFFKPTSLFNLYLKTLKKQEDNVNDKISDYSNEIGKYKNEELSNDLIKNEVSIIKSNFIKNLDYYHNSTVLKLKDLVRQIEKEVNCISIFAEIISTVFVWVINIYIFAPVLLTLLLKYAPDVFNQVVTPVLRSLVRLLYGN